MWHAFLDDCDGPTMAGVITEWIRTEERFPTIAALRARYRTVRNEQLRRRREEMNALPATPIDSDAAKANVKRLQGEMAELTEKIQERTYLATADYQPQGRLKGCEKDDHTSCGWDESGNVPLAAERKRLEAEKQKRNDKAKGRDPWRVGREFYEQQTGSTA